MTLSYTSGVRGQPNAEEEGEMRKEAAISCMRKGKLSGQVEVLSCYNGKWGGAFRIEAEFLCSPLWNSAGCDVSDAALSLLPRKF